MANSFWNFTTTLVPNTVARAEDVNSNLSGIAAGFDLVDSRTVNSIKVVNTPGGVELNQTPAARALKAVAFDSNGDVIATEPIGDWKGDHVDTFGTQYYVRDIVKDAAGRLGLNNLYICTETHVSSGTLLVDTAKWELCLNVVDVENAKTAAQTAASNASTSETNAGNSASAASTSESNAATSESNALTSANNAATSESNAATSESNAAASEAAAQAAADSLIWNDVSFKTFADSPITITSTDGGTLYSVDSSGGNVVINLPTISTLTLPYTIGVKKSSADGNTITINRGGTDEIDDGQTSIVIAAQNAGRTLVADTDPTPDVWTTTVSGPLGGDFSVDNFTDGVDFTAGTTTGINLSKSPGTENNITVTFDGVTQHHDTYTVSGTALNFSSAIPAGVSDVEVVIGLAQTLSIPADNSVTTAKLVDSAVNFNKLGQNAVGSIKIQAQAVTYEKLAAAVERALGRRNVVINGNFDIWQRGTSFASPAGYTADRFQIGQSGGLNTNVTVQRSTEVPSSLSSSFKSNYSLQFDVTTADGTVGAAELLALQYRVEGYDYAKLAGHNATLSFWVRSPKTGVHCASFRNFNGNGSYVIEYSVTTADTWEKKEITVPLTYTSGDWNYTNGTGLIISWALSAGSNFQTTADQWQAGNYLATANQVNCLDNVANNFYIAQVQFERGDDATPFEFNDHMTELAKCKRYVQELISGDSNFEGVGEGMVTSATLAYFQTRLDVEMRAAPSSITVNSAANFRVYQRAAGIACTALVDSNSSRKVVKLEATVASGLTVGDGALLQSNNTTAGSLLVSAELT